MTAPSQGQRGDARKRLEDNPHDFPLDAHDTAVGQRAIREIAADLESLGGAYGGIVAYLLAKAGTWRA